MQQVKVRDAHRQFIEFCPAIMGKQIKDINVARIANSVYTRH